MANKLKSRKSALKRFKITKNGKVSRRRSFTSHLKSSKSAKRLRMLKKSVSVTPDFAKRLRKAMGIKKPKAMKQSEAAAAARTN